MGSYKPSYHLEDGEGPRARVNCHFSVQKSRVYPPPATPTKFSRTKFSRVDSTKPIVDLTNREVMDVVSYTSITKKVESLFYGFVMQ